MRCHWTTSYKWDVTSQEVHQGMGVLMDVIYIFLVCPVPLHTQPEVILIPSCPTLQTVVKGVCWLLKASVNSGSFFYWQTYSCSPVFKSPLFRFVSLSETFRRVGQTFRFSGDKRIFSVLSSWLLMIVVFFMSLKKRTIISEFLQHSFKEWMSSFYFIPVVLWSPNVRKMNPSQKKIVLIKSSNRKKKNIYQLETFRGHPSTNPFWALHTLPRKN